MIFKRKFAEGQTPNIWALSSRYLVVSSIFWQHIEEVFFFFRN